jgi:hypothetical protein
MDDQAGREAAVYAWEGGLIIQVHRLAQVNAKLMNQLVRGRMDSEIVGAYADLRNIANRLERLAEEGRKLETTTP